jgi:hypothetical protein
MVFMNGYIKSGNYLFWTMVRACLETKTRFISSTPPISGTVPIFDHYDEVDLVAYDIQEKRLSWTKSACSTPITNETEVFKKSSILWTHDVLTPEHRRYFQQAMKQPSLRYYLYRDPRSVYLSLAHHVVRPEYLKRYPDARIKTVDGIFMRDEFVTKWIEQWLLHTEGYLNNKSWFTPVRFEDVTTDKKSFLIRIKKDMHHLGIDLEEVDIDQVIKKTDFNEMKKHSPNHIRKGQLNEWKEAIPEHTLKIITKLAGQRMNELGYAITQA